MSAVTGAAARSRSARPDAAAVGAVDVARAAAVEVGGEDAVGEHIGHEIEADRVVTHHFACSLAGYVGWHWAVTVVRASRVKTVTVDECVLLPGRDAILAPAWVPWEDRVQPEDMGPGDLVPIPANDTRLIPGYADVGNDTDEIEIVDELGLGREWVLSRAGRSETAQRWYDGEGGPHTPITKAAPGRCATCAFAIPLAGSLGRLFDVCTNDRTPFDGQVVSIDHGCGGHSDVRLPAPQVDTSEPVVDTLTYELFPSDPTRSDSVSGESTIGDPASGADAESDHD